MGLSESFNAAVRGQMQPSGSDYQYYQNLPANYQQFLQQRQQIQQANQLLNQNSAFQRQVDDSIGTRRGFSLSGGTEDLYNDKWQKANAVDAAAILAEQGAEWWNNLPGQIAGALGGDQAKQDWTFDASKFNLMNGLDLEDLNQAKNFALSLPGMMVGGVLEGAGDLYEAATGRPINEYRKGSDGQWELPDYELDASQRAADFLDAAINIGGTFTGGAGRLFGGTAKAAVKATSKLNKEARDVIAKNILGEMTDEEAEAALRVTAEGLAGQKAKFNKALHKQDLLEGMSKGVVTRAVEGASKGKPLGTVAGIAADMGDEAAEEFVQSYADDVRNKNIDDGSLNRALTGAGWGAAGGLLMGAGGRALSKVADLSVSGKRETSDQSIAAKNIMDYSSASEFDRMSEGYGATTFYKNQDLATELDTRNRNSRRAVAAAIFKMTGTETDLGIAQTDLGTWQVKKIFEQGDKDREHLAGSLGTTVEELEKIIYGDNVAEELNALLDKLPRGLQVVVGRNPDTKNGGFLATVRRFHEGEKFSLNPIVASVLGSDWDGDTASVYFDPYSLTDEDFETSGNILRAPGYFSELLVNPETGKSNVEWIWAGMSKGGKFDEDRLVSVLKEQLGDFANEKIEDDQGNSETIYDRAKKAIDSALEHKDTGERDDALSAALSQVIKDVNTINKQLGHTVGEGVIDALFKSGDVIINASLNRNAEIYANGMLRAVGIDPNSESAAEQAENLRKEYYEWSRGGTTGGSEKAFQIAKSLGLLTYLADPNSKYNPIYRQYGGLKFYGSSVEALSDFVESLAEIYGSESVSLRIIRSAFRLAQPGVDPTTAIETMCDRLAVSKIAADTGLIKTKVKDAKGVDRFIRASITSFSGYSRIYNDCQKMPSSAGITAAYDSAMRTPIDGKDKADLKGAYFEDFTGSIVDEKGNIILPKEIEDKFWRQFHRAFEERSLSEIFDDSTINLLGVPGSMSIGDYCSFFVQWYSLTDIASSLVELRAASPELCSFVEHMIRSYGSERVAVAKAVKNTVANPDINFDGMRKRYDANIGEDGKPHIDPRDTNSYVKWFDVIYRYLGADTAASLGIIPTDEFFGSSVGRALFSNNADVRLNALCSLSVYGQFKFAYNAYLSDDVETMNNGKDALDALAAVSPMHQMIVKGLLDKSTATLEWFTSLDISLDTKEASYQRTANFLFSKGNGAAANFIVDSLQSGEGKFAVSSVSAKNKRADQAIRQMNNQSWDNARREIEAFTSMFDNLDTSAHGESSLEGWFQDRCKNVRVEFNSDLLAMKAAAALSPANAYVEKGTMLQIYGMLHSAAELTENGTLLGKMDELLSLPGGHINKAQFLGNRALFVACMSDPEFEMVVYDPGQRKNVVVNQAALFNSVPTIAESGGFKKGSKPSAAQIKELLLFYPQAGGYLCAPTMNVVVQGGETGIQAARGEQLVDDYKSWARLKKEMPKGDGKDNLTKDHWETLKRNVQSTYYNDVNAQKVILAIAHQMDPAAFSGHLDHRKICGLMAEATDRYMHWQVYLAAIRKSGIENPLTKQAGMMISNARFEELSREMKTVGLTALEIAKSELIAGAKSNAVDLAFDIFANIAAEKAVANYIDIGNSEYSAKMKELGFDNFMDTVKEVMSVSRWLYSKSIDATVENFDTFFSAKINKKDLINRVRNTLYANAIKDKSEEERSTISADDFTEDVEKTVADALEDGLFLDMKNSAISLLDDHFIKPESFSTRESAEEELERILRESGELIPNALEIEDAYKDAHDSIKTDLDTVWDPDTGAFDIKMRDKVISKYNNKYIRSVIKDLSGRLGGAGVNENMVQLAEQIDDFTDRSVDFLLDRIDDGTIPSNTLPSNLDTLRAAAIDFDHANWGEKPKLGYNSEVLQAMITNQIAAEAPAGNAIVVGVNGTQQKETYALANLPAKISDIKYSFARFLTKQQIEDDKELRTCFVYIPGSKDPVSVTSKAYKDYCAKIGDEEKIAVLDHRCNAHGLPTWNMKPAPGLTSNVHEYHRLSGMLGKLADYTMEEMVMKLKKRLLEISSMTYKRDVTSKLANSIVEEDLYDAEKSFKSCYNLFTTYREKFAAAMTQEFTSEELKKCGFGADQALLLTQLLTPGILVDVTYTDGSKGKIFVDASVMYDNVDGTLGKDKFDAVMKNVQKIDKATVEVCTLREIGDRVVDKLITEKTKKNGRLSTREREQITVDVLASFSDYAESYDGDISVLLHQQPYLGMQSRTPIPASDNPVQPQMLADVVTAGLFGNVVGKGDTTPLGILIDSENNKDYEIAASAARILGHTAIDGDKVVPLPITKVWTRDFSSDRVTESQLDITIWNVAKNVSEIKSEYYRTYGVCNDPSQLDEALNWAAKTSGYLIIPQDIDISYLGVRSGKVLLHHTGSAGRTFNMIDGAELYSKRSQQSKTVATASKPAPLSSIWVELVVDSERELPKGAESSLKTGDSSRKLFKAGQKKYVRVPDGFEQASISEVFGAFKPRGEIRQLGKKEALELLEKIADEGDGGHWIPKPLDAFKENSIIVSEYALNALGNPNSDVGFRRRIVEYLEAVANGTDNAALRGKPVQGTCALLLTDGENVAPVFYPSWYPEKVMFSSISVGDDGYVTFRFSGESRLGGSETAGAVKMSPYSAPGKGMATDVKEDCPQPRFGLPGNPSVEIHSAIMSETMKSRMGGMETRIQINRLNFGRALLECSMFFETDGSKIVPKEAIRNWPVEYQQLLLSGNATWQNLWSKVADGTLKLGKDKNQNDVIRKVVQICHRQNDVSMLELFSNFRVEMDVIVGEDGTVSYGEPKRVIQYYQSLDEKGFQQFDDLNLFQTLSYEEVLFLFSAVDSRLCKNGFDDPRPRKEYCFSDDGTCYIDWGNGEVTEGVLLIGPSEVLGDYTREGSPGGSAQVSAQHTGRRADDIGYDKKTFERGYIDNAITSERYDVALQDYREKAQKKLSKKRNISPTRPNREMLLAQLFPTATKQDIREARKVSEVLGKTFGRGSRYIYYTEDGKEKRFVIDGEDQPETDLGIAINRLRDIMDPGTPISIEIVDALAKSAAGVSWSENMDPRMLDSDGNWHESEGVVARYINTVVDNIAAGKLPVMADNSGSADPKGRFPMALLWKPVAQWCWKNNAKYREKYKTFDEFAEAMKEEQSLCDDAVEGIVENKNGGESRKKALGRLGRALYLSYGDTSRNLPVYGTTTFPELSTDYRSLEAALAGGEGWSEDERRLFDYYVSLDEDKWKAERSRLERLGYLSIEMVNTATGGEQVSQSHGYTRIQEARDIVTVMNNLAETSKVMAVMHPELLVGNIADRSFHQSAARLWQWVGNTLRIGPYKSKKEHIVDRGVLNTCVETESATSLYQAMREMEFTNDEQILLDEFAANHVESDILAFVERRKAEMTAKMPGRIRTYAYKFASGGTLGIKTQMKTVVDRFVQFAEAAGHDWWFDKMPNTQVVDKSGKTRPMTRLEYTLAQPGGFTNLMMECLKSGSADRTIFLEAMNSAKAGDIAQHNAVGMMLSDLCRRVRFGNFLITTCVARFPSYGLNVSGRILNYILPMSSMNKAFIEFMSKTEYGKGIGIEKANVHTSMKEAILVDLCKMGVGGCALLLFGISGAIQPPDDERKWGNIDEWLVFGQRAGETWWLEDTLGMAIPLACFWKSCEQGKPRFDIIVNGAANACYANPMIRVSDLAAWLLNPAESLVSDYNDEVIQFANAKGGEPSLAQYIQSNAFSVGLNWMSQFFTPSLLKDWYRSSYSLEKSYKRDWERSASGQITEKGEYGATEYVTYDEAIKRKLALRNPVLALAFSLLGDKSYFAADMPNTVYYDDYQLSSTNELSVSGLEGADREARVAYLIAILQKYDDMDELANDGFHVNYETLRAVADQVWDNYHAVDDWYNSMQAEGMLDYYSLGNGDWNEGQRIAGELKKERDSMKQYWYNFYYDKLKDSPISKQLVTYNRYNTTYATDVYGEVYATGIYRSPFNFLPITTAPGNVNVAEGTSGYANDFNTPSAVTGLPLSQRALIPTESGTIELPDFESLSSDGNGKSYSNSYYDRTGETPSSTTTSSTKGSGGGSGRSGGGGGGGGGRSGVPNAYAPSTSMTKANPSRIMNTDRLVNADEYYLRPDFETKGSREAYKRSDI